MSTLNDLLNSIFDNNQSALYPEFEGWVRASRRFKAFATTYSVKIRAKLKKVHDEGGMNDLRAELEAAMLLLREERFTLEYETYAAAKQRGPDFTVTFKTHTPFNVEVRRLRSREWDTDNSEARIGKLMEVLCDKVGQMPPSIINLLWLTSDDILAETDIAQAMATLRQLAERKTDDFFTRRGYKSATDFLRQYQHLSAIIVYHATEPILWLNPLARYKAPLEMVNAMRRVGDG